MTGFLLDTNTVTYWLNRTDRRLIHRLRERREQCALSAIVMHELYFGAFKGNQRARNLAIYDEIAFPVLPFDTADARAAGEVRDWLRRLGTPIGPYDLMIAGQALARDLTLVTNNTGEFARIEGLRLEDWTAQ